MLRTVAAASRALLRSSAARAEVAPALSAAGAHTLAGRPEPTPAPAPLATRERLLAAADFRRGYAATTALAPTVPGTVAAVKNPTAAIEYDESGECGHSRYAPGDPGARAFTYFVLTGGRFIYASAIRLAVLKFILSMQASKDVLALASLEVDIGKVEPGQTITVKWRGKPVFIRKRTEADIEAINAVDVASLRDPQADSERAPADKPEVLVVVGVCTHLGCVPIANAGDYAGWFCPCHGSHYDASGRIRKGPAPYNLEVPEWRFLDDTKIMVG